MFLSTIKSYLFLASKLLNMSQNTEPINSSIGKNFIFSLLITIILGLVNIAYPIFIGLLFGPETIGNYSVLFYWSTLLNIPISNGLAIGITRFIATREEKDYSSIETIGIRITIFYIFGAILIYPFIGYFIFSLNYVEISVVIFLLINLAFHYLLRKSMQGREKFGQLFKIEIISFIFFIPLMILFGIFPQIFHWHYISDNYYFLLIPIIGYHMIFNIWMLINKRNQIRLSGFFTFPPETKGIIFYGLIMTIGSLFSIGMSQVQVIVSETYLNNLELGIIGFWTSVLTMGTLFTIAIGNLLLPRISNLTKNTDKHLLFKFVKFTNWSLMLIFAPISIILFVIIARYPIILETLTLKKFNMLQYWLVIILLLIRVINMLLIEPTRSYILSSEKRVRFFPIASLLHAMSVVISWIFLMPIYGIIGLAAGIAIGSFVFILVNSIYVLILSKAKIGLNIIGVIINSIIGTLAIILLENWNFNIIIIIISVYTVISIGFGIYLLIKILKNKKFEVDYTIDQLS